MDDVVKIALWQFNEAVSLLRSAHPYVTSKGLSEEITDSLPGILRALQGLASHVTKENAS